MSRVRIDYEYSNLSLCKELGRQKPNSWPSARRFGNYFGWASLSQLFLFLLLRYLCAKLTKLPVRDKNISTTTVHRAELLLSLQ